MFSRSKKSLNGSLTPYPPEILPVGFRYPDKYLELSRGPGLPDTLIWWFPDPNDERGQRGWRNRLHWQTQGWRYLDDIDPIPFARNGDWAAYFDGSDHSGNPRIVVADLGNKDNSYMLPDFEAWLDRALTDSGLK